MPDGYTGRSPFPPIAQYALLSDCEVTALVAPSGNVEWLCLPRPDSPSVFGSVLDRSAGGFQFSPTEVMVPAGRRYLPGTLVLETTWQTRTGWLIVRDALCVGEWYHQDRRAPRYRRSPSDTESRRCLLRTARCVSGMVEVQLRCDPAFDYGRVNGTWEYTSEGYGRADVTAPGFDTRLCMSTNLRLGFDGRAAHARTRLHEGDDVFVALCWADHEPPDTWDEAADWMWHTGERWRLWLNHGEFPDHPWRADLQRSALTLKGLSYQPTGALVAAATTSLPETPGGERNWDYRYSWIRDSTFALWGLYTIGFDAEADDFFSFVADTCEDADLQVMYGVEGERELPESILDHLTGYEGARPVRIGNDAYCQDQHDIWGAFLDSVYLHTRSRDHLPERVWPLVIRHVTKAIEHWAEPDRGIWEVRGEPQHFVLSKVMCWVACDRGARLARLNDEPDMADAWSKVAAEIHADVCEHGVDERGVFTQAYGTTALDASVLLLPLVRFLPADDERIRATVHAIADELTVNGLVLRYRTDQTDDGLSGEEGTFTICSFWLVSALSEIGEHEQARALCERLLGYASPLGLYAEELDPRTGRHLGNFPQAFTHLALINAVMHVINADEHRESALAGPPADGVTRVRGYDRFGVGSVTEGHIRELAGFTGTAAPVTSMYLDVDGRRFVRVQDLLPHVDNLVRAARSRAGLRGLNAVTGLRGLNAVTGNNGLSRAAQQSVEADLARMADHVRSSLRRSHTRGLALFSCSAHDRWWAFELATPVRNRVVINHTPYVRELEAAVARRQRFAVLLADRQRARIFQFELGQLAERTELIDLLPRHDDDKGDLTRDQVAGHAAAAASKHLRRATGAVFQIFREQGFDHLVIGAPEEIANSLERELHPYVRERIAARLSVAVGAHEEDISQAAFGVEADIERAREDVLVQRLRDALGTGHGGVAGLDAVLGAVVARRVDTLLVSDDYEAPGWRCRSCAFVGLRGPSCPVCSSTMDRVDDVVEEAVEDALSQSCRVTICRENADLDVLGRIGALTRY